jgi:hypothetical protein
MTNIAQRRRYRCGVDSQLGSPCTDLGKLCFVDAIDRTQTILQFGFDGGDEWIGRRNALFKTLHSNPLAPFVTRGVQFGSEPLYDQVLPVANLTEQVIEAKKNLSSLGIPITVSELAYGKCHVIRMKD